MIKTPGFNIEGVTSLDSFPLGAGMGRHLLGSPDLQGNVRERASAVSIRGSREGSVEPRLASYRVLQTGHTVTHGLGTTDA